MIRHGLTVVGRLGPETTPRLTQAGSGRDPRQSPVRRADSADKIQLRPIRLGRSEKRPESNYWQARATVTQDTGRALPDFESGGDPRQGLASGWLRLGSDTAWQSLSYPSSDADAPSRVTVPRPGPARGAKPTKCSSGRASTEPRGRLGALPVQWRACVSHASALCTSSCTWMWMRVR